MILTAAGIPQLSGVSIPKIYATTLIVAFYAASVFGTIATTEYEGQIKDVGDEIQINTLPDIESHEYTKGMKLVYQTPDPGFVKLAIDKARYWGIGVNLVDQHQSNYDLINRWSEHAAEIQKSKIDEVLLSFIYAEAAAANKGTAAGAKTGGFGLGTTGAPLALTKATFLDKIPECGAVLDEQNVPENDRWMVIPPWAACLLKQSDLKDASITGDGVSALRNGRLGMIDRFTIYQSNNLHNVSDTGTVTNMMFGHKSAIGFASQMAKTEQGMNPDDFGNIIRSLQCFGAKVLKPEALGHLYAKKG